jgi:hypothetical protein
MNTKLTLTINKLVIESAKHYARGKGVSLSHLVENYLKALSLEKEQRSTELTPIVKLLKGSFEAESNFDYKSELAKILERKFLN